MQKHQEIDGNILSYLKFQTPKENRGNIIIFFLIFLDLLGILPLLSEPFSYGYFLAGIIPIIFIHLWAIIYIFDPYKYEHSYYLFFGVYGIINTYVYFLLIQKLLDAHILEGNHTIIFVIGFILFLALIIAMQFANMKMFKTGTYKKLQEKGNNIQISPIIAASGIGYIISQLIITFIYDYSLRMLIYVFLFGLLSILTAYFSTYVHRYFYIKKHKEVVKQVYPEFGLPKSKRNQKYL
ncbi:hypothetical protein P4U90_13245 [Cytobacillus kochii]|uniref:hypothetical protein n=1 Tax=Cytobacillus kochii TaxID=859143 RepID=UPI0027828981|nr:hypothetical protein [Cytobacillus kochii]MDQ0187962.1 hypothetical protein [Cytobacillus kochii]MED1606286.1 hypothetical protein [Cytobacillus kochii]